jgi:hypothetical protein
MEVLVALPHKFILLLLCFVFDLAVYKISNTRVMALLSLLDLLITVHTANPQILDIILNIRNFLTM